MDGQDLLSWQQPIVYYENTEGGHAGTSNIDQFSFLLALQLAYLEDKLMN